MNVPAVVVTFNRLQLLQRTINALRTQTTPLKSIIVVDNGSTDGTHQWLDNQKDLCVIHQNNVGGAGGFHRGIEHSLTFHPDWIWCMDDDVFPRPDCLQNLLAHTNLPDAGILAPRRIRSGEIYTNDFLRYNLTNPFASMYSGRLKKMHVNTPIQISGTAFEGLFVRRTTVEQIGLPNKDLFIFCDDTDFCLRTLKANYRIYYIPDALIDKYHFFVKDTPSQRNIKKKWKRFYQVRNATYLNHRYGQNIGVRYIRPFINVAGDIVMAFAGTLTNNGYRFTDIPRFWKAYTDGIHERLGFL